MATQQIPQLNASVRPSIGTRDAARIRKTDRIPGVIYGHGQDPVHVSMDKKELIALLRKNTHLLEAVIDSKAEPVLVKDIQFDHLGSQVIHVDLARVDLTQRVTVEVGLEFTGDAIGLKEAGAIFEHPVDQIEIECLVTQIPSVIKVDVSKLNIGDALQVKDIVLPNGVTTTLDPNTTIASVSVVSEEAATPLAADGTAAEPEVIGKKVEEGAEGDAKAPAKK